MRAPVIQIVLVGVATLLLGACATSNVEEHWGDANQHNNELMIANPNAPQENTTPPTGLDGSTGEIVVEKYKRTEKKAGKLKKVPSIINISQ